LKIKTIGTYLKKKEMKGIKDIQKRFARLLCPYDGTLMGIKFDCKDSILTCIAICTRDDCDFEVVFTKAPSSKWEINSYENLHKRK